MRHLTIIWNLDEGLDIWDMSWFGNLVVELGSSMVYFGKVELGFGTLGEAFGNLSECWHSWERHFDSDEMESGKLEEEFGR